MPFYNLHSNEEVMISIKNEELPSRPNGAIAGLNYFELLCECCERCWSFKPTDRPLMQAIRGRLEVRQEQGYIAMYAEDEHVLFIF